MRIGIFYFEDDGGYFSGRAPSCLTFSCPQFLPSKVGTSGRAAQGSTSFQQSPTLRFGAVPSSGSLRSPSTPRASLTLMPKTPLGSYKYNSAHKPTNPYTSNLKHSLISQKHKTFSYPSLLNLNRLCIPLLFLALLPTLLNAQNLTLNIQCLQEPNEPIPYATLVLLPINQQTLTDTNGFCSFSNLTKGNYSLQFRYLGKTYAPITLHLKSDTLFILTLKLHETQYEEIIIAGERTRGFGITSLASVENFGIYEGKKTEVVVLKDLYANLSTNNARQTLGKVTGLTVWENDQAGLQLGIGGRGLSPNRTANFNVRQNGYDIAADALGYPEAYYTPPMEALEKIEIVRGAASLQYGTQFGGLLNFQFKKPVQHKKIAYTSRNTYGSWNFLNTYHELSGTIKKWRYFTCYQYKQGDGFRPNSRFYAHFGFVKGEYHFSEKTFITAEYTKLYYLAQQPGGLTDKAFQMDPTQSVRARNWFQVNWNLYSLHFTHSFSTNTQLNNRTFFLNAQRFAVGNLDRIHLIDFGKERTLIKGFFHNFGNETRLLHQYNLANQKHTLLTGIRLYKGNTLAQQGNASTSNYPDFNFMNPLEIDNSAFAFPSYNAALFLENIFTLNEQWTLTPGLRWEYILTQANGYYFQYVYDGAGNIVVKNKYYERTQRARSFPIAGIGLQYKPSNALQVYANFSQNYRAINFSDLRIINPNLRIDPNIQDEKGFTADLGIKGTKNAIFRYEVTLFYLFYKGKIGQVLRVDSLLFNDYRLRTNVSNARNIGIEAFGEVELLKILGLKKDFNQWSCYANIAYIDARYVGSKEQSIQGNYVEMVPPLNVRVGTYFRNKSLGGSIQFAYVSQHYSDATNAVRSASAIEGIIPSYNVWDLSLFYTYKFLKIETSLNNALNRYYFTRRAEAYPGPGIIPADPRAFYLTLQLQW